MAFQITDDVLDVTGEYNETGKPTGGDLRAGILTLPTIEYMECVAEPYSSLRKLADGEPMPEAEVSAAIQLLNGSGALVAARGVAEEFAVQARAALERLPSNQAFDALADLVTYATDRSR
jgi:geranylgeranyl pyrophosphate synthase